MAAKIEQIFTPEVPEPPANIFSNCLRVGDQIFLSGMTANDGHGGTIGDGSAYDQSRACLEKIKSVLEAAGSSMDHIVKMVVYVTDMTHREAFGKARAEFFPDHKPCSTLVGITELAQPGLVIEVDVTAFVGTG